MLWHLHNKKFCYILNTPYSVCYHQNLIDSIIIRPFSGVLDYRTVIIPSNVLTFDLCVVRHQDKCHTFPLNQTLCNQQAVVHLLRPNWSELSYNVMVHSPVGMWNVRVSGLHLSTKNVTKTLSTFKCLNFAISLELLKGVIEWQ